MQDLRPLSKNQQVGWLSSAFSSYHPHFTNTTAYQHTKFLAAPSPLLLAGPPSHSGTHGQNDTVLNQSSALPLSRSLILLSRRPVLRGFLDVRPNNLLQRAFAASQEIALEGIHPSTNLPELGG